MKHQASPKKRRRIASQGLGPNSTGSRLYLFGAVMSLGLLQGGHEVFQLWCEGLGALWQKVELDGHLWQTFLWQSCTPLVWWGGLLWGMALWKLWHRSPREVPVSWLHRWSWPVGALLLTGVSLSLVGFGRSLSTAAYGSFGVWLLAAWLERRWSLWEFENYMVMTEEEVRQEQKESEGVAKRVVCQRWQEEKP